MSSSRQVELIEEDQRAVSGASRMDPELPRRLVESHGQQLATWALEAFPVTNLYVMDDGEFYKVGFAKDIKTRRHSIQNGNPRDVACLVTRKSPPWGEQVVHSAIGELHVRGEWFRRDRRVLDAFEQAPLGVPRKAVVSMVLDIMNAWSSGDESWRPSVRAAGISGWFPGASKLHHTNGCNRADPYFHSHSANDVPHLPRCTMCTHMLMQNLFLRSRITRSLLQRALSVSVSGPI